jgi:hypothetical protein
LFPYRRSLFPYCLSLFPLLARLFPQRDFTQLCSRIAARYSRTA